MILSIVQYKHVEPKITDITSYLGVFSSRSRSYIDRLSITRRYYCVWVRFAIVPRLISVNKAFENPMIWITVAFCQRGVASYVPAETDFNNKMKETDSWEYGEKGRGKFGKQNTLTPNNDDVVEWHFTGTLCWYDEDERTFQFPEVTLLAFRHDDFFTVGNAYLFKTLNSLLQCF